MRSYSSSKESASTSSSREGLTWTSDKEWPEVSIGGIIAWGGKDTADVFPASRSESTMPLTAGDAARTTRGVAGVTIGGSNEGMSETDRVGERDGLPIGSTSLGENPMLSSDVMDRW